MITKVKHPQWSRSAVMYEVNVRQYTKEGTFQAFSKYLSQLKSLGVDILWFMPIHPISKLNRKGSLGSYYAVQDYLKVNPEFGTLEDFKTLVEACHDLGFKVMIDWVANHTGCDHIWTKEHPEWYVRDKKGNFKIPYDWDDTYQLNYKKKELREAMLDALKFWVNECDIDGYRCDVAYEVPVSFWDKARKELDKIKPVFMLAEAEHPPLTNKAFDMVYNWSLKDLMQIIAKGKGHKHDYVHQGDVIIPKGKKHAKDIDRLLKQQDDAFPTDVYQMNKVTNHDLNSWEGSEHTRFGKGLDAFVVLTYTLTGMPMIYTGQEVGYDHVFKFFDKDAIPASQLIPNDTFKFYQKLNYLKHQEGALLAGIEGGEIVRYKTESKDTYIFEREKGGSRVMVFLNLSSNFVDLQYKKSAPEGNMVNFFNGEKESFPKSLKPWEYKVFVNK